MYQGQTPAVQTQTSAAASTTSPAAPRVAAPKTSAKKYNVSIIHSTFSPAVLSINRGDTVIWLNQDYGQHQIAGGSFVSPLLDNGQYYSFVFNKAGTFNYHCAINPSIKGTVVVR